MADYLWCGAPHGRSARHGVRGQPWPRRLVFDADLQAMRLGLE